MPTLAITKTYSDGTILFEQDLDNIRTSTQTFFNVTKIDNDNIQDAGIDAGDKLEDGTISTSKYGSASVTRAKIEDAERIPTGAMMPFAGIASAPTGWLICDGAAVSRTTYADLFAVMGTVWGIGDGSTTFNLPDTRGRAIIGTNDAGLPNGVDGARTTRNEGDEVGSESHTLSIAETPTHTHTINHGHSVTDPEHQHGIKTGATILQGAGAGVDSVNTQTTDNRATETAATGLTVDSHSGSSGSSGSGNAHTNMQPSVTTNWIVKF